MAYIIFKAIEAIKDAIKKHVTPPRPLATVTQMSKMEWLRRPRGRLR